MAHAGVPAGSAPPSGTARGALCGHADLVSPPSHTACPPPFLCASVDWRVVGSAAVLLLQPRRSERSK